MGKIDFSLLKGTRIHGIWAQDNHLKYLST